MQVIIIQRELKGSSYWVGRYLMYIGICHAHFIVFMIKDGLSEIQNDDSSVHESVKYLIALEIAITFKETGPKWSHFGIQPMQYWLLP